MDGEKKYWVRQVEEIDGRHSDLGHLYDERMAEDDKVWIGGNPRGAGLNADMRSELEKKVEEFWND